jgi:hypothetical protein
LREKIHQLPILELAPWHQADTPQAAQGGPPALTKEDSWGRQHGTKTAFAPMGVFSLQVKKSGVTGVQALQNIPGGTDTGFESIAPPSRYLHPMGGRLITIHTPGKPPSHSATPELLTSFSEKFAFRRVECILSASFYATATRLP